MAAKMLEFSKLDNLLLASMYSLSSTKTVTMGYHVETLKPILVLASDKNRFVLSTLEYKRIDDDGWLWKAERKEKNLSVESVTLKEKVIRERPNVFFLDKNSNLKFSLDELEITALARLRTLISTYLLNMTINRCTVVEFVNAYKQKLAERGCWMEFSDFAVNLGLQQSLDFYRLYLEIPVLCPNMTAAETKKINYEL